VKVLIQDSKLTSQLEKNMEDLMLHMKLQMMLQTGT